MPTGVQLDAAIQWWVSSLNIFFSVATDPCRHVAPDGSYDVSSHFNQLLSIEQLFRTVQSLSVHDRDGHARRGLMFDAFDTLEHLRKPDFVGLCRIDEAERALTELTTLMDADVAAVLLPRASSGVEALRDLQSGFFLPSRVNSAGVTLPEGTGQVTATHASAASQYLRVLRNAIHGFGGRSGAKAEKELALLSAHNGSLPSALPDLAYLYLLRLLAQPASLK